MIFMHCGEVAQQKTGTNARIRRATSAAVFMIMIENKLTPLNY